jgi:putative transposase
MIFIGQASLCRTVAEYMVHYHGERNHQGLQNRLIELPAAETGNHGAIHRRARLGGTLNFYYRKAA